MLDLKNFRKAFLLAQSAGTNVELSAGELRQLIDEIDVLRDTLAAIKEEVIDAQLIDLNYGEAKGVRADLLEPIRRYLENVQ